MTRRERLTNAARRALQRRAARLVVLALACLLAAALAYFGAAGEGWGHWVESWVGRLFRALSGAVLGFWLSRLLGGIRFSEIPGDQRGQNAIAQAVWAGALAIAVAN